MSAPEPTRILPDGCMDLLFDLTGVAGPSVVGAMTRALVSAPRTPRVSLLGVRFRPGEAFAFLDGGGARAMRDALVPLREAWTGFACELGERLGLAPGTAERIAILDRELPRKRARASDPRVRRVVRAIRTANGGVRVAPLAASVGLGERQLERLFDELVGVGPKALASIVRVQALVNRIGPRSDWARLAADLGWSDQAHLTRDLGRLAGVTPSQLGRALGMSDSFNPPNGPLPIVGL